MSSKWQFCDSLVRTISDLTTAILATAMAFVLLVFLAPIRIGVDSQCSLQSSKSKGGSRALQTESRHT